MERLLQVPIALLFAEQHAGWKANNHPAESGAGSWNMPGKLVPTRWGKLFSPELTRAYVLQAVGGIG
jgi:hypothetical protein